MPAPAPNLLLVHIKGSVSLVRAFELVQTSCSMQRCIARQVDHDRTCSKMLRMAFDTLVASTPAPRLSVPL
eukprot:8550423-Karenia_brevis.AAC.1